MNHDYTSFFQDVQLIPMTLEDSERYRVLRNDPKVRDCFEYKNEISQEEQKNWYMNYLNHPDEIMLSVYSNDVFLGGNSLYRIDDIEKTAEYGRIVIDKRFSGNGYGYKATMAMIALAKEQLGLKEITLEVYKDNISANVSYRKAGFEDIGTKVDAIGRKMTLMKILL